jgi:IS5 family transposase
MARQPGFSDVDGRLRRLSAIGVQLEAHADVADFEIVRSELDAALNYSDGAMAGRPPFDAVMLFKILIIRARNNLSDAHS